MGSQGEREPKSSPQEVLEEEIVIVGAGIGGLACALALHRVGLKSLVLEQADSLRTSGGGIIFWTNAFRVLDVLGVGDRIRDMFIKLTEWEFLNAQGKSTVNVVIGECKGGPHEIRMVERSCLQEVFASELPKGTIRFNSRVTNLKTLKTSPNDTTNVQLQDGIIFSAKVVIGYDGINSNVGSWMGLEKPKMVGYCTCRGSAIFPNGHQLDPKAQLFIGKGRRFAYFPMTTTKIHWFLSWNTQTKDWKMMTGEQLKNEALERSKPFSKPVVNHIINNTPIDHFWTSAVRQRLNRHHPNQTLVVDNITVAGDACHPMTPHLGQGGAMALEDAIVLARHLYGALVEANGQQKVKTPREGRINEALKGYQEERWTRTCSLAEDAHMIGWMTQSKWTMMMLMRDWVVLPWIARKETFMDHTMFDVGRLPMKV